MNNDAEHIKNAADRIRSKGAAGMTLGHSLIEMVKANKARAECFHDCALIMASYPRDFPLTPEMQAH